MDSPDIHSFDAGLELETEESIRQKLGKPETGFELFERAISVLDDMDQAFDHALWNDPDDTFDGKLLFDGAYGGGDLIKEALKLSKQRSELASLILTDTVIDISATMKLMQPTEEQVSSIVTRLLMVQEKMKARLIDDLQNYRMDRYKRIPYHNMNDSRYKEIMGFAEDLNEHGNMYLSKSDYREYFQGELKQSNVGNCYLIASFDSLSKSAFFEVMVRSAIEKIGDGSWDVRIPLIGKSAKTIRVHPDEVRGDWDESGKYPLSGPLGYRILEAAYLKWKHGSVDRKGEKGGHPVAAMKTLIGRSAYTKVVAAEHYVNPDYVRKEDISLQKLPTADLKQLKQLLKDFNPQHSSIVLGSTFSDKPGGDSVMYSAELENGDSTRLAHGHAYSLVSFDPDTEIVTIVNPWDTGDEMKFTFDQIVKNFSQVHLTMIHPEVFYKDLQQSGELCSFPLTTPPEYYQSIEEDRCLD